MAAGAIFRAFSGREESDGAGLLREGHDVLGEHGAAAAASAFEVYADEEVVVAGPQRAGQVRVLQRVQQLRLVHVAAQSMRHAVVAQRAHGAVEAEGVRVEPLQVQALRQLQNVHASAVEMGHGQGQTTDRQRDAKVSVSTPSRESPYPAGSRFCEVCRDGSRSLLIVLEVPSGLGAPCDIAGIPGGWSGTLGYLRVHGGDLVTLRYVWDPQIGTEPPSGRPE